MNKNLKNHYKPIQYFWCLAGFLEKNQFLRNKWLCRAKIGEIFFYSTRSPQTRSQRFPQFSAVSCNFLQLHAVSRHFPLLPATFCHFLYLHKLENGFKHNHKPLTNVYNTTCNIFLFFMSFYSHFPLFPALLSWREKAGTCLNWQFLAWGTFFLIIFGGKVEIKILN